MGIETNHNYIRIRPGLTIKINEVRTYDIYGNFTSFTYISHHLMINYADKEEVSELEESLLEES